MAGGGDVRSSWLPAARCQLPAWSAFAIHQRRVGEGRGNDAAVRGERVLTLLDSLRGKASGDLRFLERCPRMPVRCEDRGDELRRVPMERGHFLKFDDLGELVAGLGQREPDRLEPVRLDITASRSSPSLVIRP